MKQLLIFINKIGFNIKPFFKKNFNIGNYLLIPIFYNEKINVLTKVVYIEYFFYILWYKSQWIMEKTWDYKLYPLNVISF